MMDWVTMVLLRILFLGRADADGARGVEDQEEAALPLVDTPHQLAGDPLEGGGRPLERVLLDLDDFADLVDEEADNPVVGADDEVHGQRLAGIGPVTELKAAAEVDGGDDLSPKVDEAADDIGGQRDAGHLL